MTLTTLIAMADELKRSIKDAYEELVQARRAPSPTDAESHFALSSGHLKEALMIAQQLMLHLKALDRPTPEKNTTGELESGQGSRN